jgi:hypothetical protein
VEFFSKVDIDEFLNYFNRLEKRYLGLLEKNGGGGFFYIIVVGFHRISLLKSFGSGTFSKLPR